MVSVDQVSPTVPETQIAEWWHEAEEAIEADRPARARRFLRWILAVAPEEEKAWLWLACLATRAESRMACLRQARAILPASAGVQQALRQAYHSQLELASGPLAAGRTIARCLPHRKVLASDLRASAGSMPMPVSPPAAKAQPRRQSALLRALQGVGDPAAWMALLLPLAAYLLTACRTVYNLDSAEFSTAAYVLGIVRATGYPLYLLLGKLFTLLPVADVGFRLNLMSAACGAGTGLLVYRLVRRLTSQPAAALAASLLLSFSYYFWAEAVIAEVYTLHTLLLAALLILVVRWQESRSDRMLAAIGLLYGLSFGNHLSTVLLAPGLAVFLLAVAGRDLLRPRRLLWLALPFAAGVAVYLYLPLRYLAQPAFNYAGHYDAAGQFVPMDLTQPRNIWWLVSGRGFQGLMFDYSLPELVQELRATGWRLWGSFLGIGLVPGLIGLWIQAREKRRHLALFGLAFLANLLFFAAYRVPDKETLFLPVYVVWAVWVGIGYSWLVNWIEGRRQAAGGARPRWAWALAVLALVALAANWRLVDVSGDTRARDRAASALDTAQPGAVILGWWSSAPAMQYLQLVEDERPDVLVINRFLIGADEMYALIDRSLGRRPVYVVELDKGLAGAYSAVPAGPLFELMPRLAAETSR